MPVRIEAITIDCRDERRLSAFWTAALGYEVAVDQPGDWIVLQDQVEPSRVSGSRSCPSRRQSRTGSTPP